jgi:hypothetical protein
MGLPKKNIEKKNIFRENHVEVRHFDGIFYPLFSMFFGSFVLGYEKKHIFLYRSLYIGKYPPPPGGILAEIIWGKV